MKTNKKGFTLIELLVVIAIIGILASVVLASLSTARGKGNDAKVKGQLASVRNAAEIYYSNNNKYGPASTDSCTTNMFADTASGMAALTASSTTSFPTGTNLVCNSTDSAYAVSGALSTSGQYWCVDSNGISKQETAALGSGVVACP